MEKSIENQNKELRRLVEILYDKVQAYDKFIKDVVGTIEKKKTQIERDLSSIDSNYITTEKLKANVLVKSYREFAYKGKWSDIEKEIKQIIGAN